MLSDKDYESYVPKDASEESAEVSNILSSIREKLNQPVESAEKELIQLSQLLRDSSNRGKIIQQIQTSIPKSISRGTVAEGFYACVAPTVDGVPSPCTPSCQTSGSHLSAQECTKQVFMKEDGEEIQKLNNNKSDTAYVYVSDSGSRTHSSTSSNSTSLTKEDISALKKCGVTSVEIFSSTGNGTYKKVSSICLSKSDSTHYSKNSQCDVTEKFCKEENSYNWLLMIGVVVFLLLAVFFVIRWYSYPTAAASMNKSSPAVAASREPYTFE